MRGRKPKKYKYTVYVGDMAFRDYETLEEAWKDYEILLGWGWEPRITEFGKQEKKYETLN